MSTQTGSISFEAAGGFNSYAKQNYATLSQIKGQFATCGTGASTAAKVATIVPTDSGWTLYDGATITVKFTSKNTAENPTLNVNGTGARPIKDYAGNNLTQVVREWPEGTAMALTYDGSSWRIQDSNLMERVHTAETDIKQTATSITSLATLEDTYIKPDGTTGTNSIKSQFTQTANAINAKVDKNGVIASINASVEEENGSQIKISADKVNITGTTIFSALGSANKVVTSTQTQWYSSTSATTKADGSWGTTQPTVIAGRYIWERQYITYSNGDTEYKPSEAGVCVQGQTDLSSYSTTVQANNLYDAKGAANTVNNTLTNYMSTTNSTLQSLQNQVDGQIEAWFFDVDPAETSYTATATPTDSAASTWTTAEIKERHVGDLYYNTVSGHSWRWMKDGNNYKWLAIPDSDAAAALAAANAAQATANSKRRIFTTQPTTPYDKGDLWVNGDAVKYCGTARASGNYNASDWVLTATDDTLAQSAKDIANAANATEQTLYYASNSTTVPAIPTAQIITNSATIYGAWNLALPTYSATYPYLYTCLQRKTAGGMYSWTGAMQSSYAAWTSTINTTANNAAPKNSAVSRTQRIYYRQTANGAKPGINETWLATSGTGYGNWSLTIPQLTSGTTKYPKLYTAVQTQTVAQQANNGTTCSCSPVQLDDSTTVIDGGNIITGSVTANQIASNTITANEIDATNLHINAANIDGTITFGQLSGVQAAGNYATTTELTTETNQRKAQYGTCDTTAATQAKVVTCANFELVAGNELTVKFSTANTYASGAVQLNVNSKGAKNVWVGNAITSTTNKLLWGAGAYITFRYDGTQFIVIGEPRTWYGACNTAEGTAAKTDTTAVTGCVICKGTKVELAMTNANTADAPTLNIQSTGALAIYFGNGTVRPTKAGGTSWLATNTCTFTFDGATWRTQGKTYIDANSIITGYISADRINAGSIGVNKIDASSGTFNTANIPELSAAKITSGDIAADRIKANAVSAINATADKIDAKNINVSAINIGDLAGEIGGRNLLSEDKITASKYFVTRGVKTTYEGDGWWHLEGTWSYNSSIYFILYGTSSDDPIDTSGGNYVLSCEVEGGSFSNDTVNLCAKFDNESNSSMIGYYLPPKKFDDLTKFQAVGYNIKAGAQDVPLDFRFRLKLEKGSKATDWSPAPEDVNSAIDDASQIASNYIHANSTGINIYDSSLANASKYYLRQTAGGTYIYRNSYLKAKYEDTITLYGGSNVSGANPKVELTSTDFKMTDGGGTQRLLLNSSNGAIIGNPSKGRTQITDEGMTIYDTNSKKRTTVDASGLTIYDTSTTPVDIANFGSTVGTTGTTAFARIGQSNSSRFEVSPTTLSAYSGTTKYFEVSANGLTWGNNNTAATTTQVSESNNAANTVVTVYPVTIDYAAGTATLAVKCMRGTDEIIPSAWKWTKGTSTTELTANADHTLTVTDLNAVYNCTVTISV